MFKHNSAKFGRPMITIYPGEYYVSTYDEVIHTVLGSCISACLFDKKNEVAGMNHFMLPGSIKTEKIFIEKSARYGMFAMELLINEILRQGGKKKNLKAKIFGGGHIISSFTKNDNNVPESNIRFIKEYLNAEKIPIVSEDIGGWNSRKIFFFPRSLEILLSRLEKKCFNEDNKRDDKSNKIDRRSNNSIEIFN